jgi:hypothetical protein
MTVIDERFLMHRLRSTSMGGVAAATRATLLWLYRYTVDRRFSWDLFAVALTMIVVKWTLMIWYRTHE